MPSDWIPGTSGQRVRRLTNPSLGPTFRAALVTRSGGGDMSTGLQHKCLVLWTSIVLIASTIVVGGAFGAPPAAASTYDCYDNGYHPPIGGVGYDWQGYYTKNYANQGIAGDINYQSGDVTLDGNSYATQHGLMWITGESKSDTHDYIGAGNDWLQVGWMLGIVGVSGTSIKQADTTKAYSEADSPWVYEVLDWSAADKPWGDRWFQDNNQGTTRSFGGHTYGEWLGTYSNSFDVMDYSWLIDPTAVKEGADIEGMASSSSAKNCPAFSHGLFGTNGNQSDPGDSNSTVMEIENNSTGWYNWDNTLTAPQDASAN